MAVSTRGTKSSKARSRTTAARGGAKRNVAVRPRAHKWVYLFDEGSASMRDLLGGKGAGVAEMTRAGLPVPPGFTITTEACNAFYARGRGSPPVCGSRWRSRSKVVEENTGKGFGDARNPLLVSVRTGAKFSMPGMMDTVLNLGLNAATLEGLASLTKDRRFALDAYRRFIQLFGKIVLGIDGHVFEEALDAIKKRKKAPDRRGPHGAALEELVDRVPRDRQAPIAHGLSRGPDRAAARGHRRCVRILEQQARHRLPQLQPHSPRPGHRRQRADDGLRQHGRRLRHRRCLHAQSRRPARRKLYGEYLINAQGEDVVAGIRTPKPIAAMATDLPEAYRQFEQIARTAGEALPRRAGPGVHDRARQAVHAADAQRQAHRRGRREDRGRHGARRAHHQARGGRSGSSRDRSISSCIGASTPRRKSHVLATGLAASPGAATARRSSTPTAPRSWPRRARR